MKIKVKCPQCGRKSDVGLTDDDFEGEGGLDDQELAERAVVDHEPCVHCVNAHWRARYIYTTRGRH